jgi:hypothetical protein
MTVTETFKLAAGEVRSKPLAPFIGAAAVVVWWSLFYLWLGLPLGGFAALAAVVVGGMVLAGALGLLIQQSVTLYRQQDGKWRLLFPPSAIWVAKLGFLMFGLGLPWLLIQWVPEFKSMGAQAVSAAVRFTLAVFLLVTTWLFLWAVVRRVIERDGEDG